MAAGGRLPIAVDAMGGDNAPGDIVRGAIEFVLDAGQPVILVGARREIDAAARAALARGAMGPRGRETVERLVTIVDAGEMIRMDEHPASAVRAKRDSSLVRACGLVAGGRAGAVVSAGNSGAMLAAALFSMKRIAGVSRPAIGTVLPTRGGRLFLLDVGANTECRAGWLTQFAVMGNVYAKSMMDIPAPRIALLSNGEEAGKGSHLVNEVHPLMQGLPLDFVGNIEGNDLFNGRCDVAVTDGFTGNVVLKTAEGAAEFLFAEIRSRLSASMVGKVAGTVLRRRLRPIREQVDYRTTGGALLLGVRGEAVIAHGRSDSLATANAIRVARRAMQNNVSGAIADALRASAAAPRGGTPVPAAASTLSPDTSKEHPE